MQETEMRPAWCSSDFFNASSAACVPLVEAGKALGFFAEVQPAASARDAPLRFLDAKTPPHTALTIPRNTLTP
jgi:hypothetical protein